MTSERRATILRMTPLELRAYVIALLAAVYAISWRVIDRDTPVAVATTPVAPEPQPTMVWLDSLPEEKRPAIALPAEWQIASRPAATPAPPRIVHTSNRRVPRVRTRSS